jgi:hypothetical protein
LETTTTIRSCHRPATFEPLARIEGTDQVELAIDISAMLFSCADQVVVAPAGDLAAAIEGAEKAIELGGPLLFTAVAGDVDGEIERLTPEGVVAIAPSAIGTAAPDVAQALSNLTPSPGPLWLVDENHPEVALAAISGGGKVVLVDGTDLRQPSPTAAAIADLGETPTVLVGDIREGADWQLQVVRTTEEFPGGGHLLFPGRRLVAFYGNPSTGALGVLGEQGPQATIDRLLPIAAQYAVDGVEVIPTFEIIATVASSRAGGDNDYSDESTLDLLRPWVDLARTNGVYVVLDLQPGRTDYLTQAKRYEELLIQPHVGLALDPEWRLSPDQVHLRQIGSVDATEINAVADWLAGLVRQHHLPQKLLLVHQFKLTMIENRDLIQAHSELALVIQMDGQGPLATKYETFRALTAGADDAPWFWGWKNFYDEDSPMATPQQVLDLEPTVVFVSYQ